MAITDFLKGFKPNMNEDGDGPVTGQALTKVLRLYEDKNKEGVLDRYRLELEVKEVLDGSMPIGKRFWKSYFKDNESSAKEMANDMFTSGIELDYSSEQALVASFPNAIEKDVVVRAWGHTFDKRQDGTPIPVAERKPKQFFVIKARGSAKVKASAAGKVPF